MRVAVIHGAVAAGAGKDEQDVLVQVAAVAQGLAELGHEPVTVPISLNLAAAAQALADLHPDFAFNLVESLGGRGSLIHVVPALLDTLKLPYTGAGAEAMMLTSNKLLAKQWLAAAGLPTPPWITIDGAGQVGGAAPLPVAVVPQYRGPLSAGGQPQFTWPLCSGGPQQKEAPLSAVDVQTIRGPWLVKSVWEHASIGLDEDSVIAEADRETLFAEMARRQERLGGACFAEAFVDGREFNLSLLAGERTPLVLPPAEIRFDAYPPGKVRVVGYRSKWEKDSFEFNHTPRSFAFPEGDAPLLASLEELARGCWELFALRGHARVDFRVDREGRPWILEVNANPCLSPDAGFVAATREGGLDFGKVLRRIIGDMPRGNKIRSK